MNLFRQLEENFLVHLTHLHRVTPGMSVTGDDSCVVSDSGLAADYFNTIYLKPENTPETAGALGDAVSRFRSRGQPFAVWGESKVSRETSERLRSLGLRSVEEEPGLTLDLTTWQSEASGRLEIHRVEDAQILADFSRALAAVPAPLNEVVVDFYRRVSAAVLDKACPMSLFVGYRNDEPVATCEVCITDITAGIYNVTTLPQHRRRGIATAMVTAGLDFAVSGECTLACLSSSVEGVRIYERLGFRKCCSYRVYQ